MFLSLAGCALAAVSLALAASNRRQKEKFSGEVQKMRNQSAHLLEANTLLEREGLTEAAIASAIRQQPSLVSEAAVLQAVEADPSLLSVRILNRALISPINEVRGAAEGAVEVVADRSGLRHQWVEIGKTELALTPSKKKSDSKQPGSVTTRYITDRCKRCDLIYRYYTGGRHPDFPEGYFVGGNRVEGLEVPLCRSQLAKSPAEEAEETVKKHD